MPRKVDAHPKVADVFEGRAPLGLFIGNLLADTAADAAATLLAPAGADVQGTCVSIKWARQIAMRNSLTELHCRKLHAAEPGALTLKQRYVPDALSKAEADIEVKALLKQSGHRSRRTSGTQLRCSACGRSWDQGQSLKWPRQACKALHLTFDSQLRSRGEQNR